MRWMFLACLATACVEFKVSDDAAVLRVRPVKPWGPVAEPAVDGADGVLADEKIPCIREGGFGKRCPIGEKCVYDRAEDGTKSPAYCVDKDRNPTGNVPSFRGVR